MEKLQTHKGFEIVAAEASGYFVSASDSARGEYRGILFAGDLGACLEFVRLNIVVPDGTVTVAA